MRQFMGLILALFFVVPAMADFSYTGVGITIQKSDKVFEIIDLIDNGPAHKAGIQIGERVVAVDGNSVKGLSLKKFVETLAGAAGTPVVLTLNTKDNPNTHDVKLIRETFVVKCIVEGNINLSFTGNVQQGWISGWVGNANVSLNVFGGQASGTVKGIPVNLWVQENGMGGLNITGYIRNTYIQWQSFSTMITGFQQCIY